MGIQLRLYRKLALAYLGGKCMSCGSRKKLALHHVDGNPLNDDVANVALLCWRCHMKAHQAMRSPKDESDVVQLRVNLGGPIADHFLALKKKWGLEDNTDVMRKILSEPWDDTKLLDL